MQLQYGQTPRDLRLETERENLLYVLSNTELTQEQESDVKRRLTFVENELLRTVSAHLPN